MNLDPIVIVLSALCIVAGQLVRAFRVRLIYGEGTPASFRIILSSLLFGAAINLVLPYRIGDIIRIAIMSADRKVTFLKALSVFAIDRITDITVLLFISLIFLLLVNQNLPLSLLLLFSLLGLGVTFVLAFLMLAPLRRWVFERLPSWLDHHRQNIQFGLYWVMSRMIYCFTSLNFVILTLVMWGLYFVALYLILDVYSLSTISGIISNISKIHESDLTRFKEISIDSNIIISNFLAAFLVAVIVVRTVSRSFTAIVGKVYYAAIVKSQPRLFMLEALFSKRADFISSVLMKDVNLIMLGIRLLPEPLRFVKAHIGGSGAIIVSFEDEEGNTYVRKYAERDDLRVRLENQFQTLLELSQLGLPISEPQDLFVNHQYTKYDMKFSRYYVPFPEFALSSTDKTLQMGQKAVVMAMKQIYDLSLASEQSENVALARAYIQDKVLKNVNDALQMSPNFSPILKTPSGVYAISLLQDQRWCEKQIAFTKQSTIHGDTTLENFIICKNGNDYRWIDPNSTDGFSTVLMDMAKLMQSLHCGYDFHEAFDAQKNFDLAMVQQLKPKIYHNLEIELCEFVSARFGEDALREVYFHELVHYARLLRYKFAVSRYRGDQYLKLLETLVAVYAAKYAC